MRSIAPFFAIPIVAFSATLSASKDRAWQNGTLLDSEHNRVPVGAVGNGSAYGGSYSGSAVGIFKTYQIYVVDSGTIVYEAEERQRWKKNAPNVMVNAPVRFAVEGHKLFILDGDGKEHEAEITKQTLKVAPPEHR